MKKLFIIAGLSTLAFACGNNAEQKEATTETKEATQPAPAPAANADADKGVTLIANSDCLTCHKVNEKSIGPSYADVAKKYEDNDANVAMLASKIIKGGQGVWGEVPMTPHPQLSEDDAKVMVKYILSLKNQ